MNSLSYIFTPYLSHLGDRQKPSRPPLCSPAMAEIDGHKHKKNSTGERERERERFVSSYQPPTRRRLSCFSRRKLPTVRLGGKSRRGFCLVRIFRRHRLKFLKLKCNGLVKKLRVYYRSLANDMIEGSGSVDAFQQRLILETSFAVPVMGFFSSFPTNHHN